MGCAQEARAGNAREESRAGIGCGSGGLGSDSGSTCGTPSHVGTPSTSFPSLASGSVFPFCKNEGVDELISKTVIFKPQLATLLMGQGSHEWPQTRV